MAGGMFAGHDQCGGDTLEKNGKKYKLFYGMSSATAMEKHAGKFCYKDEYVLKIIVTFVLYILRWCCRVSKF